MDMSPKEALEAVAHVALAMVLVAVWFWFVAWPSYTETAPKKPQVTDAEVAFCHELIYDPSEFELYYCADQLAARRTQF